MTPLTPRKISFRSRRNRKRLKISHIGVVVACVCVALLLLFTLAKTKPHPRATLSQVAPSPTPTPYFHTIALLGYGGGDHDGGALTDSIIVARIDDRAHKVFLISIPRDLWIDLPIDRDGALSGQKINAAYALGLDDTWFAHKPDRYRSVNGGGGRLAQYALEQVVGERIDHFVAVSFKAFVSFIDSLGGVTITRDTTFEDAWFPVEGKEKETCDKSEEELQAIEATLSGYLREQAFPCRYETLRVEAGTQTLDGETALKYVRSRHSDYEGGDFYRSQRQRQIVNAIKEKALSIFAVPKLIEFAQTIHQYVDTDYALADIPGVLTDVLSKQDYTIESIALTNENVLTDGTGPNGEYMLIPRTGQGDWPSIKRYLHDRFAGMSEASASAKFNSVLTPTVTPKK